jgi:hypothetical protein
MSSREHELDYADDPQSLRDSRRSRNLLVVIAISVGVFLSLLVAGLVVTRLMFVRAAQAEAVAARQAAMTKAAAGPKLYERGDFKALILAKSEQAVIDALGQPIKTVQDGDRKYLYYRGLTKDPKTGEADGFLAIEVVRDHVVDVEFNLLGQVK